MLFCKLAFLSQKIVLCTQTVNALCRDQYESSFFPYRMITGIGTHFPCQPMGPIGDEVTWISAEGKSVREQIPAHNPNKQIKPNTEWQPGKIIV